MTDESQTEESRPVERTLDLGPTAVVRERVTWGGAVLVQLHGLVQEETLRQVFDQVGDSERALVDLRGALLLLSHIDWLGLADETDAGRSDVPIGFVLRDADVGAALAYRDAMVYRRRRRFCFTSREFSSALAWAGLPLWMGLE